ncbi:hypothetical protein B0T16DRAFT_502951 [Cercophora newfieldiana]|uniref:Ankyrin n=1 Tax=Cercophora newfieldiana TaxID=92897 RepID=A0AA40D086_9PEZI|nr:hypothetical protein B0T16DRAFT_502951 [Cercophora newfieldiana]
MEMVGAVAGILDVTVRTASKVWKLCQAWQDAPEDVHRLRDDLARTEHFFDETKHGMQAAILGSDDMLELKGASLRQRNLKILVEQGISVIESIEEVINALYRGEESPEAWSKTMRVVWLRYRAKVAKLRKELSTISMGICRLLIAQSVNISAEIHASIERSGDEIVAHIEDRLVGTTGKLTTHIDKAMGSSESVILTHLHRRLDTLELDITKSMRESIREEMSPLKEKPIFGPQHTIRYKNVPSHILHQAVQVVPRLHQDFQCDAACVCNCHSSNASRRSRWGIAALTPIMGSISLTWSGSPASACTDLACRETQKRRPSREVSVVYKFPDWVTRAALSVLYSSNLNGTPELVLRVLNPLDGSRVMIVESVFGYVSRNDVEGLKQLLAERRGSVYDVWGRELQSPLAMAVMRRNIDIIKVLIQAGADPFQELWVDGNSSKNVNVASLALKHYVAHRETQLAELLPIARQFDLEDRPVLHMIVTGFLHLDLASALQNPDHLPDINRRAMGGHTPLHFASMRGDVQAAKLLLRAGADINAHSTHIGTTPLHQACSSSRYDVVKLLLSAGAEPNRRDFLGSTPLLIAASHIHSEAPAYLISSLLLQNGADPEIPPSVTSCGGTPVIFAAAFGSSGSVRALLEAGANVNYTDLDGDNALFGAVYHRQYDSAECLLKGGTKLDTINKKGRSILHALARCADERMMEIFASYEGSYKGLSTIAKDGTGLTPLGLFNERKGVEEGLRKKFDAFLERVEGESWVVKGVAGELVEEPEEMGEEGDGSVCKERIWRGDEKVGGDGKPATGNGLEEKGDCRKTVSLKKETEEEDKRGKGDEDEDGEFVDARETQDE